MVKYLVSMPDILASWSVLLTMSLTFGILFSTALRVLAVAKPAIIRILPSMSVIFALKFVVFFSQIH